MAILPTLLGAQQYYFTLSVKQPAVCTITESPLRLLLVNNALPQPDDLGHKTVLPSGDADHPASTSVSVPQPNAVPLCLFALNNHLQENELFPEVAILEQSQVKQKSFYSRHALSQAQADSLCDLYGTDAVLALDQLVVMDVVEAYLTTSEDYYAYLKAYTNTRWTIYYQQRQHQPKTFVYSDTLIWDGRGNSMDKALQRLPNRQDALQEMVVYAGEEMAARLTPQWKDAERYLYVNKSDEIIRGMEAFRHQQWDTAIHIWEAVYNDISNHRRRSAKELETAAFAAADIALAYEIKEDYARCREWAKRAQSLFQQMRTASGMQHAANLQDYLSNL